MQVEEMALQDEYVGYYIRTQIPAEKQAAKPAEGLRATTASWFPSWFPSQPEPNIMSEENWRVANQPHQLHSYDGGSTNIGDHSEDVKMNAEVYDHTYHHGKKRNFSSGMHKNGNFRTSRDPDQKPTAQNYGFGTQKTRARQSPWHRQGKSYGELGRSKPLTDDWSRASDSRHIDGGFEGEADGHFR